MTWLASAVAAATTVYGTAGASAQTSACAPSISGVGAPDSGGTVRRYGPAGATVTITGANFSQSQCALTRVRVGNATIAAANVTVASGGGALSFRLPSGASGTVAVVMTDSQGLRAVSNANLVFLETPTATLRNPAPAEGTGETVQGSGFAPFVAGQAGSLRGAGVSGLYSGCDSMTAPVAAAASGSTSLSLPVPSTYCNGPLSLQFTAPADISRPIDCTDAPGSASYNCIALAVPAGAVDVAFNVTSVSPPADTGLRAGSVVQVSGTGFGSSGRAWFGSVQASAAWSDTAISATMPAGADSGQLTLQRAADLTAARVGPYLIPVSVIAPPAAVAAARSALPAVIAATVNTLMRPQALPPPEVVSAALAAPSTRATAVSLRPRVIFRLAIALPVRPGRRVAYAVRYMANGKPVADALIHLHFVRSPGRGAMVTPAAGRTDRHGVLHGLLLLSKTPGRTCLRAVDGTRRFMVCVRTLAARATTRRAAGSLPFGLDGPHPISAWLATAGAVLVLLGILVNINVLARTVWAHTGGRLVRVRRGPPI